MFAMFSYLPSTGRHLSVVVTIRSDVKQTPPVQKHNQKGAEEENVEPVISRRNAICTRENHCQEKGGKNAEEEQVYWTHAAL